MTAGYMPTHVFAVHLIEHAACQQTRIPLPSVASSQLSPLRLTATVTIGGIGGLHFVDGMSATCGTMHSAPRRDRKCRQQRGSCQTLLARRGAFRVLVQTPRLRLAQAVKSCLKHLPNVIELCKSWDEDWRVGANGIGTVRSEVSL
jgi:hypothetical protein